LQSIRAQESGAPPPKSCTNQVPAMHGAAPAAGVASFLQNSTRRQLSRCEPCCTAGPIPWPDWWTSGFYAAGTTVEARPGNLLVCGEHSRRSMLGGCWHSVALLPSAWSRALEACSCQKMLIAEQAVGQLAAGWLRVASCVLFEACVCLVRQRPTAHLQAQSRPLTPSSGAATRHSSPLLTRTTQATKPPPSM